MHDPNRRVITRPSPLILSPIHSAHADQLRSDPIRSRLLCTKLILYLQVGNEFGSVEALWSQFENFMGRPGEENEAGDGGKQKAGAGGSGGGHHQDEEQSQLQEEDR